MEVIGPDHKIFNFLSEASVALNKRQICLAKTMLRCPAALMIVQNEALNFLGDFQLVDSILVWSINSDMVSSLRAAERYLKNTNMSKGDFPVHESYKTDAQFDIALWVHFSDIHSILSSFFALFELKRFTKVEISEWKSPNSKIMILKMSFHKMRLFQ